MTDQFMAEPVIREKYGLSANDSFDEKFSKVSLENIYFFIVAAAIFALEAIFEQFKADVDNRIAEAVLASIPWYHKVCMDFQYGDELVYDEKTKTFGYAEVNESKKLIKYAAVRENASGINILVSGDENGVPKALSDDVLTVFKTYLNKRKPAGVLFQVYSYDPDLIQLDLTVQYDPMLLNADGSIIGDTAKFPIESAVKEYLSGIVYGGTFNKTKLVDAVQGATGVVDVVLGDVRTKPMTRSEFLLAQGNNVVSVSGAFAVDSLKNTISYVQEL
jgi:hypothetical protein